MDNCYDLIRIRERRLARRERKQAERLASRRKETNRTKKARKCSTCGRWIRKVELFYNGEPQGRAYIHIRTADMRSWSPNQLERLTEHVAQPRAIPQGIGEE